MIQRYGTQMVTFPVLGQVSREDIRDKESLAFQISLRDCYLLLLLRRQKLHFG